ncbi:hypothetical protein Tco_0741654 [Tanacetum coccineum]
MRGGSHTNHNGADPLTKAFDVSRDKFENKIGSCKVNAARQAKHIEYMSRIDGRTCNIKQKCVKSQTPRQAKRGRDTKIPQSGGPPEKVGDEAVYKGLGDKMDRAATTASSLEAELDSGSGLRTSSKVKIVNGERQIQALVEKKKVIITETSIRSDLKLDDAEGTNCLPTATIFAELERMGYENLTQKLTFYKAYFSSQWKFLIHTILQCLSAKTTSWNEFSSTMASAIICLATNKNFNFSKYIFDNMVKNLEGGVKFLMYPRFVQVFLDKQVEGMSRHKGIYVIPSHTKKVFANMKRPGKGFSRKVTPLFATMMIQATEDMGEDAAAPTDSHSTPIHTQLSSSKPQKKKSRRKHRKDSGPTEPIPDEAINKEHVGLQNLIKLWKIESLKRRVRDLEKVKVVARTPRFKEIKEISEMNDDNLMFDTDLLEEQEKEVAEKEVSDADPVTIAGESLIEIKAAKPKVVKSAATTTTTTRPKARGVIVQEPSEFKTTSPPLQASQLLQAKDKGKAKIVEPEKALKKKDQIAMDEEVARNLEAQLKAELEEEERISRLKEENANRALLESWDNIQAMMDADFQLAQQMQTEEQEQLSIEENLRLLVELLEKRKKHFAALRAQEKKSKPSTKAQKRNTMSTYLKNMDGYKHNQLKSKRDELKSDNSKKQKIDEHVEAEKDDDQEEAEMKKHIEIVKDDEVAIDAIPLATKPPVIVKCKIDKDGRMGYFKLIRADGSSKRYVSMIKMLQDIDREDLETLWKLVKAKHENTRPEEDYERVLWGDLKVMFEPDIKSEVWRNLQGYKVTVWKLFDNCGVHFVRFKNLHIFMLVEKRYPLTPITISNMLNKKLQADHWNEINLKIQMMNIKFRGGLLGLKDFKMILRVTAAKLQLLSDYYCWKDYADRDEIQDGLENKNTYEDKY